MNQVSVNVINRINHEIGSETRHLQRCNNIMDEYRQRVNRMESELFQIDSSDISSKIKSCLTQYHTSHDIAQIERVKIDKFERELSIKLNVYRKVQESVSHQLNKVRSLQHFVDYLKIVKDIQDIGKALLLNFKSKEDHKTVGTYLILTKNVIGRLENVFAPNLKLYAEKMALFWYNKLNVKFSNDFESMLQLIKWPYMGSTSSELINPSKDALSKLVSAAEYLFLLESLEDKNEKFIAITPSILCAPLSTPVEFLIKPFRQRFLFHFSGARQTNRSDKPEWFYTQILNWARDNHLFVGAHIQPASNLAGRADVNIRLEFIRGLVQLTVEKLCNDIDGIITDAHLFSHLIDETLSFEQELRDTLGYPNSYCSALDVITQAKYLTKWIAIEEQFTTDKMDAILASESAWILIDPNNLEDLKIPKCADQFIRLLDAIRERYCNLQQPGYQLQFLNLQLELIESFRRRLVQLHNSPIDHLSTTMALNTINYLNSVLREWGENVHYLHLYAALFGPHSVEINSVFDKVVDDMEHWQKTLVRDLASKLVDDIKAKSMAYRRDIWNYMPDRDARQPFMISTTAGEMFQLIVTSLHNLETELSINIFNVALRLIALQLDDFFIDSMIMNTKFSTGGAAQFVYDMNRNLFVIFGQYARRPDLLFKKINDACKLLVLPFGNAKLLCETIKQNITSKSDSKEALIEHKLAHITNLLALDILERRIDICSF